MQTHLKHGAEEFSTAARRWASQGFDTPADCPNYMDPWGLGGEFAGKHPPVVSGGETLRSSGRIWEVVPPRASTCHQHAAEEVCR